MYAYTYITYMCIYKYIYIYMYIYYTHIHTQSNAHNSTSGLSTLVFQDLLLIRDVLMSSQTVKKLLPTN